MKVVCTQKNVYGFTVGKVYQYEYKQENGILYNMINDYDKLCNGPKCLFICLKKYRKEKLEKFVKSIN